MRAPDAGINTRRRIVLNFLGSDPMDREEYGCSECGMDFQIAAEKMVSIPPKFCPFCGKGGWNGESADRKSGS